MYKKSNDICDDYAFRFLNNVDCPATLLTDIGMQSRSNNEYYWENKNRQPCFIFQYTLSGSGTLKTRDKTYIVKKNDAFFLRLPDDESYYFDEKNNKAPWEFVYIRFVGNGVLPYYKYITDCLGKVMSLSEYHPAIKVLLELYSNAKKGLLLNAFAVDCEVFRFLCLLCDIGNCTGRYHSHLITNVKSYLDNNFEKQIIFSELAEHFEVSQSHLSREFFRCMGEQPLHYLTRIRLEKATKLLNTTNMSLEEISISCGFSDSNYFSKIFKKHMKISPGKFRNQIKAYGYTEIKV